MAHLLCILYVNCSKLLSYQTDLFMKQLCFAIITLLLCSCISKPRCFYVDSITGKDSSTGVSPDKAWKSLDKLNEQEFSPGDRIYFKAGTEYFGQFTPKGSGTEESPIIVNMFDEGEKPILHGEGRSLYTFLLNGESYWEINNLEITNQGLELEPDRVGIWIKADNRGDLHHIYLRNLIVSRVNGGGDGNGNEEKGSGIYWQTKSDSIPTRFIDLLIEQCHIYRCYSNGITGGDYGNCFTDKQGSNVVIRNNLIEQITGKAIDVMPHNHVQIENNVIK